MSRTTPKLALALLVGVAASNSAQSEDLAVNITRSLDGVTVKHAGKAVRIQRNQDQSNVIHPAFARTSRACPPFCVQPMRIAEDVETIGEIEMLDYLERASNGDDSILVIDSRGPDWLERGTIPGSVNIHYKRLSLRASEEKDVADILTRQFDVERSDGGQFWNFRHAKTLVMYCNGAWCGQSPTNIRALLRMGYPPSKIKWYRGGMQSWETLGLTTVVPE